MLDVRVKGRLKVRVGVRASHPQPVLAVPSQPDRTVQCRSIVGTMVRSPYRLRLGPMVVAAEVAAESVAHGQWHGQWWGQ